MKGLWEAEFGIHCPVLHFGNRNRTLVTQCILTSLAPGSSYGDRAVKRSMLGGLRGFSLQASIHLFLRADGYLQGMLGKIQVTGYVRAGGCLMDGRLWGGGVGGI